MYTINPTCPLCGLRYADRMLLDLHIREDHAQRQQAPEPGPGEPGDTGPPRQAPPRDASPGPPPAPPAARTAQNRAVLALRRFHQEMMLASALLVFRVPPSRPQATMTAGDEAPAATAAEHARQAA